MLTKHYAEVYLSALTAVAIKNYATRHLLTVIKVGFMSKVTPLNNKVHSQVKVNTTSDFTRFKTQHLIPIVAQDFAQMATEFPVVFVKNSETGQFLPVAMMGIKNGVNLYCQEKHWPAAVTPLGFSNAPLSLVKKSADSDEVIVCIDEDSNLVSTESGEALFDDNNEQTDYLKKRSEALLKVAEFTHQIQAISQFFAEKKLLVSRQLTVKLENEKEPFTINGVYLIDEKVLNELSTEEFDQLRKQGLLPLIYSHLTSLQQITRLTMKHNQFIAQNS